MIDTLLREYQAEEAKRDKLVNLGDELWATWNELISQSHSFRGAAQKAILDLAQATEDCMEEIRYLREDIEEEMHDIKGRIEDDGEVDEYANF